jgi:hypothetical protein
MCQLMQVSRAGFYRFCEVAKAGQGDRSAVCDLADRSGTSLPLQLSSGGSRGATATRNAFSVLRRQAGQALG